MSSSEPGLLTKSRFFVEAFNTAIIDGPLRIYFSDKQESEALQIYFDIQDRLAKCGLQLTQLASQSKHAFIMLYPDHSQFSEIFSLADKGWATDNFGENIIFGLKDGAEKEVRQLISNQVTEIIQTAAAQ